MNYPESSEILQLIKEADRILLNCHSRPDADSVGSAQALRQVLLGWGKEVKVICPDEIPRNLKFLEKFGAIDKIIFRDFNFFEWDLLICLDSSSWQRVAADSDVKRPMIKMVVIDHHKTNTQFGDLNLLDPGIAATCQLLINLFKDWDIDIKGSEVATPLLTGIIGDTGAFRFPEADAETFKAALNLMEFADKDEIIKNLYQSYELESVKLWGEILENLEINSEYNYVWSAIGRDVFGKYGSPVGSKSEIADIIFQSIKGTEFGMVIVEENDGYVSVSLRSRSGFDVSEIAEKLDGGGHRWAAAGKVIGLPFDRAIKKIHNVACDVCKNQKRN